MKRAKGLEKVKWYDLLAFIVCIFLCFKLGDLIGTQSYLYFGNGILTMSVGVIATCVSIFIYLKAHSKWIGSRSESNV